MIFCFTSHLSSNLLTLIADRIARVLNTSDATQTVVLDISITFYRVWHIGLIYGFRLHDVMKRYFILLSHLVVVKYFELSTSLLLTVPIILQDIFPIFFALSEQKESEIKLYEKLEALSMFEKN